MLDRLIRERDRRRREFQAFAQNAVGDTIDRLASGELAVETIEDREAAFLLMDRDLGERIEAAERSGKHVNGQETVATVPADEFLAWLEPRARRWIRSVRPRRRPRTSAERSPKV
jgi:hypothetical protein